MIGRRRTIVLMLGLLTPGALVGCRSFRARSIPLTRNEDGTIDLDVRYLKKKQTIEVKGSFDGDRFEARSIEIEDPDDEIEVKANLRELDDREGTVGGVSFSLDERSRLVDPEGESIGPGDFPPDSWVKAECKEKDDSLILRKLSLRNRRDGEEEEIQGEIGKLERGRRRLLIGETPVRFSPDVPVLWTLEGDPPDPAEGDSAVNQLFRTSKGIRKIRRIDEDQRRPDEQLTFGGFLTVGGEIQYDLEWRDNHDLNDDRARDRLVHGIGGNLEVSLDLSEKVFGFVQAATGYRYVHFDQDRDLDFDNQTRLREAFLLLEDLPANGVSVQVGRQDIDHGREWVVDENLDAFRLYFNLDNVLLEASWSSLLYQETPQNEDVQNILLGAHADIESQELFAYALHRRDGKRIDFDRTHVGLSVEGEVADAWTYWFDGSYVFGKEDDTRVEGYGFDQILMYVIEDVDPEPSFYLGYAWGSGDDDPNDGGQDHTFRQTGLNDNNSRFNGVTSFRYLGELVRPELENLAVTTLGFGLKTESQNSMDLVFHRYRQVDRAPFLGETRLRRRPDGNSKDVGDSLDLVLGIEKWRPLEIEIVLSHFRPGRAFAAGADPAWFGTVQIEWNF